MENPGIEENNKGATRLDDTSCLAIHRSYLLAVITHPAKWNEALRSDVAVPVTQFRREFSPRTFTVLTQYQPYGLESG